MLNVRDADSCSNVSHIMTYARPKSIMVQHVPLEVLWVLMYYYSSIGWKWKVIDSDETNEARHGTAQLLLFLDSACRSSLVHVMTCKKKVTTEVEWWSSQKRLTYFRAHHSINRYALRNGTKLTPTFPPVCVHGIATTSPTCHHSYSKYLPPPTSPLSWEPRRVCPRIRRRS